MKRSGPGDMCLPHTDHDIEQLSEIQYVDRPEIAVSSDANGSSKTTETIEMPFKYVKGSDGQPIMPKGMHELLASDADKDIMDLL